MESTLFIELTNTEQESLSGGQVERKSSYVFGKSKWECSEEYDDDYEDYIWTCTPLATE